MKKLYIPGRVWLNQNDFTNEFPQTKLPLVMLLGHSLLSTCTLAWVSGGPKVQIGANGILLGGKMVSHEEGGTFCESGFPLGIDQWAYDKKVETYRDIVKFVLSPEFPLTIKFQPNPDLTVRRAEGQFFSFGKGTCPLSFWSAPFPWDFSQRNLAWIMAYYMKEIPDGTLFPRGFSAQENCRRVYKDRMIDDFASRGFKYFEIKTQAEWRQLNEVYGINDVSQVPANTISYVVTGQPPPVPKEVNWQSVEMWSALFSDPIGISILNAVAKNLPVKVKTRVENWKNPDQYLATVTREEDKKKIVTTFTYVWQDFEFEVDAKCSIVVRYNRGMDTAEIVTKKESDWKVILTGIGFLAAAVAIFTGIGALVTPTVAPATGAALATTVPTAGILGPATLTAPTIGAPTLTGIAGYSELMTLGTLGTGGIGVTGSLLTAGAAIIPTVAGEVAKATLFETIVAKVPSVLPAIAKAGIGVWSASEKAKIQEELLKAGYDASMLEQVIPEGKTTEGYAYKAELFGIDPKMLLLIGGAVVATYLIASGGKTVPKARARKKKK